MAHMTSTETNSSTDMYTKGGLTVKGIEHEVTGLAVTSSEGLVKGSNRDNLDEADPEEELLHGTVEKNSSIWCIVCMYVYV
jgi:hypothetical protein